MSFLGGLGAEQRDNYARSCNPPPLTSTRLLPYGMLCNYHDMFSFTGISTKMAQNNAFTVAKRTLEGQDMIYQSIKLTNGIWALVGQYDL